MEPHEKLHIAPSETSPGAESRNTSLSSLLHIWKLDPPVRDVAEDTAPAQHADISKDRPMFARCQDLPLSSPPPESIVTFPSNHSPEDYLPALLQEVTASELSNSTSGSPNDIKWVQELIDGSETLSGALPYPTEWDTVNLWQSTEADGIAASNSLTTPAANQGSAKTVHQRVRMKRPVGMVGMQLYSPAELALSQSLTNDQTINKNDNNDVDGSLDNEYVVSDEITSSISHDVHHGSNILQSVFTKLPGSVSRLPAAPTRRSTRRIIPQASTHIDIPAVPIVSTPHCSFNRVKAELSVTWCENGTYTLQKFSCKKLGKDAVFKRAKDLMEYLALQSKRDEMTTTVNRSLPAAIAKGRYPDEIQYIYDGPFTPTLTYIKTTREWNVKWIVEGIERIARWSCKKLGKLEAVSRAERFVNLLALGNPDPQIRRSSRSNQQEEDSLLAQLAEVMLELKTAEALNRSDESTKPPSDNAITSSNEWITTTTTTTTTDQSIIQSAMEMLISPTTVLSVEPELKRAKIDDNNKTSIEDNKRIKSDDNKSNKLIVGYCQQTSNLIAEIMMRKKCDIDDILETTASDDTD